MQENTLMTSEPRAAADLRPRSLKEVALRGSAQGGVDDFLREFMDEFYAESSPQQRAQMLAEEPPLSENQRLNAYLAAVAEHLAFCYRLAVPAWVEGGERFLARPYFPAGLESLKATLLIESPVAFRRRMIFVGADPLFRPRKVA